ncbi:alpha-1,2-fucosyltransferase [Selenomonas sp. TAMA-11512]|uniref:alpha-1,2-fucosyltransferase n=1 Tax=Selenomonas sp. TAMA-11512 TaxID=3095337 RepID=UPI0030D02D9E
MGNQLFQLAFFRMLECMYPERKIKADLSAYWHTTFHQGYELERIFDIRLPQATRGEIARYSPYRTLPERLPMEVHRAWQRILKYKSISYPKEYFSEPMDSMEESDYFIESLWKNEASVMYLDGFWVWMMREKYKVHDKEIVSSWENRLRRDLIFPEYVGEKHAQLIERMKAVPSISVHIRRGDYIGTIFDACDEGYYIGAMEYILQQLSGEEEMFVFSDDIEAARSILQKVQIPMHFIEGNYGNRTFEDMYLMSQCKHHIIANSTFSYWGAHLSAYDGITVAPKEYYRNTLGFSLYDDGWNLI